MQETKKTWRAPIAGLASVAMIATMGVAAVTANAAEVDEWTFDANGMPGVSSEDQKITVSDSYDNNDRIDQDEINAASAKLLDGLTDEQKAYFTGWYTSPNIGEGEAVQPGVSANTVVYAHWSKSPVYTATFEPDGRVSGGVTTPIRLAATDTAMDHISAWQVPSVDAVDHYVVTGWTGNGETVDPTSDWRGAANVAATHMITFKPVAEEAYQVTFGSRDFANKQWEVDGNNSAKVVDVRKNTTLADAGISLPTAKLDGRQVTDWAIDEGSYPNMKKGDAFTTSTVVSKDLTVRPAAAEHYYSVKFMQENGTTAIKEVTVAEGDSLESVKPADPTKTADNYRYKFVGWYKDGKAYDLSTPVTGPLTLQAKFEATAVKVTFDPHYDQAKAVEVWYSAGQTFKAPEFTRDGYVMTWMQPIVPDNAVLSIAQDTPAGVPALTYIDASGVEQTVALTYVATWHQVDKINLERVEKYVVVSNLKGAYLSGEDQSTFTAESYDQYIKDYQKYLADKADAKASGSVLTVDETAQLFKELADAQTQLKFNRTLDVTRLYNDGTRRHNLTKDANEVKVNTLNGFHVEGVAFKVVDYDNAVTSNMVGGVYRADANGAVLTPAGAKVLLNTVSRYYNPGIDRQLYTADDNEAKVLEQTGWRHEADNDLYIPANGSTPVYRYYITATMEHVMTTDRNEYDTLTSLDPGMYKGDVMTFNL